MESDVKFVPGDRVVSPRTYVSPTEAVIVAGGVYTVLEANKHWLRLRGCNHEGFMWSPEGFVLQSEYGAKQPPEPELTGGSSDYYKLPPAATDIMDLIEHKKMEFALGNIFKAAYRLGDKPGTTRRYDLEKIIYFAQRELDRL